MKVILLGVEFHSENRGCGALAYSICEILKQVCEIKKDSLSITAVQFVTKPLPIIGDNVVVQCIKNEPKKIGFWKQCYREFKNSDLILDFSMGDSFADIYGKKRFFLASALKELAIHSKTKFIMAPQTIGPFSTAIPQMWAKHILKKCDICFVRDKMSQEYMFDLCKKTPILTTDVAFSLPYKKREKENYNKIRIGFNPSGLLWSGTKNFSSSKHIKVDYKEYVGQIMKEWLSKDNVEVHLIPHVFSRHGTGAEDDKKACREIHDRYPGTIIEEQFDTPMEIKSIIATMDVFVGARMHATIAAFSSGVATIPFSYSRKFEGLYHDLGYDYLIGGTVMGTNEAVSKTLEWTEEFHLLQRAVKECQKKIPEKQETFFKVLCE